MVMVVTIIQLVNMQNKRGGKVKLQSIVMPLSEFDHAEKGDALYGEFSLLSVSNWLHLKDSLLFAISFMYGCMSIYQHHHFHKLR